MINGILRIAKESLFSGLHNLAVDSLLSKRSATSFGFTEAEVKDLAEKTGAEASLGDLTRWYNGYRFGGEVIYNPWSILNSLASEDKGAGARNSKVFGCGSFRRYKSPGIHRDRVGLVGQSGPGMCLSA